MKSLYRLLLLAMLVATLALVGCEGDDGRDGVDGKDFQLPPAEAAGLVACASCHAGAAAGQEYVESKHAMNSDHSIASCATACHNPSGAMFEFEAAFGELPSGTVVGCEDCHGMESTNHVNLPEQEMVAIPSPMASKCAECHDAEGELAHLTHHPFNELIYSRFELSGHGEGHAREAFCSACHSNEGALSFFAMGGAEDAGDALTKYNPTTVQFDWASTEEELSTKQCNSCHNPHNGKLRAKDTVIADSAGVDTVVFSAEFNTCTTCHMVELDYAEAGHSDAGTLFAYTLTDAYSAANMVDATTNTFIEESYEIFNADGTVRDRSVYAGQIFYHDNTPGGGRSFIDTHFAGQVVGRLAAVDETADPTAAVTDVTVTGYNINAANPDACTVCHDPHSANKVQGDDLAVAVAAAEGVGTFHANYLGAAMGHGCAPCHNGQESFVTWLVGGSEPTRDDGVDVIACRTCHQLEQYDEALATPENPELALGDPTMVREFNADHVFAFSNGAEVPAAELGVSQICFECHKGRTGAPATEPVLEVVATAVDPANPTPAEIIGVENREYGYLHYAPSAATLFGAESGMFVNYNSATYPGRFAHPFPINGVNEFNCADCHNVHNSGEVKMTTSINCNGCHGAGADYDAEVLKADFTAVGDALLQEILAGYLAIDLTAYTSLEADLAAFIATLQAEADPAIQRDEMAEWLTGRTNYGPSLALAKAGTIWKQFNYEDGKYVDSTGMVHGHGGAWAHNSRFAEQLMNEAIADLAPPAL